MVSVFYRIWELVVLKLSTFWHTDWSSVNFGSRGVAITTGIILAVVIVLRFFVGRLRFFRAESGHSIYKEKRESWFRKGIYFLPRLSLGAGLAFLIFALAEPFLSSFFEEQELITVRERYDLIDASDSMAEMLDDNKTKAEVAREEFMKFLEMRTGKGDRACLWVFSDNPYRVQDCVTDDEVYKFQVFFAPHILGRRGTDYNNENLNIRNIKSEAGTNLAKALKAISEYIKERGSPDIKRRVLLMITDAVITTFPDSELNVLRAMGVVPYIFLIGPKNKTYSGSSSQLLNSLPFYGGKVFRVSEPGELEKAFQEFDRIEKSEIKSSSFYTKNTLFQRPLFVALVLLIFSTIIGLLVEIFLPREP